MRRAQSGGGPLNHGELGVAGHRDPARRPSLGGDPLNRVVHVAAGRGALEGHVAFGVGGSACVDHDDRVVVLAPVRRVERLERLKTGDGARRNSEAGGRHGRVPVPPALAVWGVDQHCRDRSGVGGQVDIAVQRHAVTQRDCHVLQDLDVDRDGPRPVGVHAAGRDEPRSRGDVRDWGLGLLEWVGRPVVHLDAVAVLPMHGHHASPWFPWPTT